MRLKSFAHLFLYLTQVNTIEFDPLGRYLGVGCRDKTFTIFDTSTFVAIKIFHTTSWVTSISWALDNTVAIRSGSSTVSVLDLSPIQKLNMSLFSPHRQQQLCAGAPSLSWSRNGQFLVRSIGSSIAVVDSLTLDGDNNFRHVTSFDMGPGSSVVKVVFCHAADKVDLVAAVNDRGRLVVFRLRLAFGFGDPVLIVENEVLVEPNIKALAWSPDGCILATGGEKKLIHLFATENLKLFVPTPIACRGRIWDIDFVPGATNSIGPRRLIMGIALGDNTTTILNESFEPVIVISRTLTCRCVKFHPSKRILAIGDGDGTVAIVDFDACEQIIELDVGGRANALAFSPAGDFLVVGTDSCRYAMYETAEFHLLQEIQSDGFAHVASFSPSGRHLALGSENESYMMMSLGPFLGVDMVPLAPVCGVNGLPSWALNESLFHSCRGPSFLQRQMALGGHDALLQVTEILRSHPNAIYTFDRRTGEGSFDTALLLQKPRLVRLVMTSLVDGTLDPNSETEKNFLTTAIPLRGRETLADIVDNYPPDDVVEIFNAITFMKVPYTGPRAVESRDRIECGSMFFADPWSTQNEARRQLEKSATTSKYIPRGGSFRTPAVLPLPGLGDMDFLASLLASAPPDVFDNDAMALVLRVLWKSYIRQYFYLDFCLFLVFYICWIILVETGIASGGPTELPDPSTATISVLAVFAFNTIFAAKELVESRYGRRTMYFRSLWNIFDVVAIAAVYAYATKALLTGDSLVHLAVCTTLFLTVKLLSYLRGFSATGWLLSVLEASFRDVRGFLVILSTILVGFSVAFRLLLAETGDSSFGSLRRSFLSTFELTVIGSYDSALLSESRYTVLATITFILAVTCVLVVAFNALISILADSYARVQQNATANRRREVASLCVEYMSLLPPWKRRQIEKNTKWFHTLLEIDSDGSLRVQTDDWKGGLNALRREMEEQSTSTRQSFENSLRHIKTELDFDIAKFKKEVVSLLVDVADDVKYLRKAQFQGILKFDAKQNIAKAVRAVRSVGRKGGAHFETEDG